MFKKDSIEYKICELSTKINLMDKTRVNDRKEYLQALHTEHLNHLKTHFNLKQTDQGINNQGSELPNPDNGHESCEVIEL